MTAILLALGSSACYGSADFLGGLAARSVATLTVAFLSAAAGLALLALAVLLLPPATLAAPALAWGALAGVASAVGITLFYGALARGPMSVVAPVAAVCGLSVPVLAGLGLGERPPAQALAGVVLAAAAVVLVSRGGTPVLAARDTRGVRLALGAGLAIGAFYVVLGRAPPSAGLWPLVAARAVATALLATLVAVRGRPPTPTGPALATIAACGLLDALANLLYVLAVRGGLLSVVAPLASLYPAATVLLARVVLGERVRAIQMAGLAVAALAATLIGTA